MSFRNFCGQSLNGRSFEYAISDFGMGSACKEIVVKSPNFSILKWIILTTALNLIAFVFDLYLEDFTLLVYVIAALSVLLLLKLHYKVTQGM